MAGLYGLKILLLLAGLIELAICQKAQSSATTPATLPLTPKPTSTAPTQSISKAATPATSVSLTPKPTSTATTPSDRAATPATSVSLTPKPTSTATTPSDRANSDLSTNTSASETDNQTQTSDPASTSLSTDSNNSTIQINSLSTSTPPTQNQTSPASTPTLTTSFTTGNFNTTTPKCSYKVNATKYGFRISISNLPPTNVTISYKEQNDGKIQNITFSHSQNASIHNVMSLKPCTNYTVTIEEHSCDIQGSNNLTTLEIEQDDITANITKMPGVICYSSPWDIREVIKDPKFTKNTSRNLCFKLEPNDYCSNVSTTFEQKTCDNPNSTFTRITYIPVEKFIDDQKVDLTRPQDLPAKLKWTNMPVNCLSKLTFNYTCRGYNKSEFFSVMVTDNDTDLPEMEPFTAYNCTSHFNGSNKSFENTTNLKIDCDLNVLDLQNISWSNESISLNWSPEIKKCPNTVLSNIAYECCCNKMGWNKCNIVKKQCNIHNLEAFTDYNCFVKPVKYNDKPINNNGKQITVKTAIGVPDPVEITEMYVFENNAINVTCNTLNDWRGSKLTYHARITPTHHEPKENTEKCKFTFKGLSYLTTYTVEVFAKNEQYKSAPRKKDITTEYNAKALIGFLIFLIILTSLALLFVLYKIYILRKKSTNNGGPMPMDQLNDENSLLNVEPIGSEVLLDAYKRKIADEGRLFLQEFQSIPRIFSRNPIREAKKSCNQPKNRYVDILPYDYNRVQLTTGNGEAGCDYINASFIDGFKESKKYIAAQGPKDETVADFWRMVWEQQSSIIVMVTRCEEGNRVKCAQYWPSPEREAEIFEEFIVKLNGENHCPDYTIRHLSLANKRERCAEREVTHIQFTSWPDHGVPGEPHLLLKLRRRVNSFKNFFSGPIVIHCSAGVGRTGTYMGIDAMMEGLEAEGRVDIYGYVVRLRRQRCLMVQVEAQYILIHQALIEHNQFGETEIPLAEFHSTLSTLKQKEQANEPTLLDVEFQRLPWYKNWRTFNTGVNEDNKKKNRYSSVIPYDYNRVLVKLEDECSRDQDDDNDYDNDYDNDESSDEEEESTKYINATHIDGYWCQKSLIATQGPLPDTIGDFWQMVFQKKIKTIVMLTECQEGEQEFCSAYWGDEKRTFGDIEVEVTATETLPAYTTRSIQIRHAKRKESRQMKQYHFLKWAGRELPEKPQDFMDMIKNIKQTCGYGNGRPEKILPAVVHCNDGSSRSGIFCALWNLMDSAETEKLVDVFQVAKALRKERQGMINSLEQYQFLYDAVEGAFPVQNGEVKHAATTPSGADSVQVINENKPEQPASATIGTEQQALVVEEAEESTPLVAEAGKDTGAVAEGKEDDLKDPGSPTEKTPLGEGSNGPVITVDV